MFTSSQKDVNNANKNHKYQSSKRSFTYHQQEAMWQLWSQGKSLSEIGRQLNNPAVADATGDASIQAFNTKGNARGGIIDAVSIHDRPEEVNDRIIPGHWEGDLICGTQKSYIAT